jgi:hypothetical protein
MKKSIILVVCATLILISFFPNVFAHLEQKSSGGVIVGKYYVYIGFNPQNPIPGEKTKMIFSIQDNQGNDIHDIQTMIEVYNTKQQERLFLESWSTKKVGDFEVPIIFDEKGTYQVVLSISDEIDDKSHVVPPRNTLSGTSGCGCIRALFNVTVSDDWNNIWNSLMVIIVVLPFSVFGYALFVNYRKKNSKRKLHSYETIRYIIIFLAFAGGIIHLTIYVDHVPLRIEYGIFLLLAAITQIGFGVLFLSTLLLDSTKDGQSQYDHRRNKAINLFGLIGSLVLLGLYFYVVNFPAPLSPENHPEEIGLTGVIAKSLEISLIIAIIYSMKSERKWFLVNSN